MPEHPHFEDLQAPSGHPFIECPLLCSPFLLVTQSVARRNTKAIARIPALYVVLVSEWRGGLRSAERNTVLFQYRWLEEVDLENFEI